METLLDHRSNSKYLQTVLKHGLQNITQLLKGTNIINKHLPSFPAANI